jgi:hypothetical protein
MHNHLPSVTALGTFEAIKYKPRLFVTNVITVTLRNKILFMELDGLFPYSQGTSSFPTLKPINPHHTLPPLSL